MDETKVMEMLATLADAVKAIGEKCDAVADAVKKRDAEDDPSKLEAEQTAADARSDAMRGELNVLRNQVNALTVSQRKSMTADDADAFADTQAKADAVMAAHGKRAEPPLQGEHLIDYQVRTHKALQQLTSKTSKWRGAALAVIARDSASFQRVCEDIRADSLAHAMSADDMPEFQHRKVTRSTPTGHMVTEWVGNGTFVKAMSRPVRHVISIGAKENLAGAYVTGARSSPAA
jgi:hypothetical protein